ncbi:hypothetical protein GP2143_03263 [marine gamma proteobacterium HTCC2143]|uniref:Uncharacterized protein n=1 Tax=marine gamma proteobacterium HTCC2143 TaxID=247633 RepID=A0YD04_9GAMM|nr:hypothetical protein GP2143_03263 [marine gamma proteobacterium HTCC2143]
MILGLRNAVFMMPIPKVIPDKVGCDLNEIVAMRLHKIAINTPIAGINIDNDPNISAIIAIAFIVVSHD